MTTMKASHQLVLLCDLDGVLRSFDRVGASLTAVEVEHGLPANALLAVAFGPERLQPVITGRTSHDEWVRATELALVDKHGIEAAGALIRCWTSDFGEVVSDVLATVQELRRSGWRVLLATNATSRLGHDLEHLGLIDHLDAVANSSEFGSAKPDHAFYAAAQRLAGVPATHILFVDDKASNVTAAIEFGMAGVFFENSNQLRTAALRFAETLQQ